VFECLREDWRTAEGNVLWPGLWVMVVYRFGCWRYRIAWRWLRIPFSVAYKIAFALVSAATGAVLPCETRVGRRLRIDHSHGIVVSGDASLGDDVIWANAVVLTDVPPHSIAVGIPAKIRPRKNLDPWREECVGSQDNGELHTAKVC